MQKMQTMPKSHTGRQKAGRALWIFFLVMALITLANQLLQEMIVPVVEPMYAQRGALTHQIDASATLSAGLIVPVTAKEKAHVQEVLAKVGAQVQENDGLFIIDFTETLMQRHAQLVEAIHEMAKRQQALDEVEADLSTGTLRALESRREALRSATPDKTQAKTRTLMQMEGVREYIAAENALISAQFQLTTASDAYFDLLSTLDEYEMTDTEKLVKQAVDNVRFGAAADAIIQFDRNSAHYSTLRAPMTGEVTSVDAAPGEVISSDKPALTLGAKSAGLVLNVEVSKDEAEIIQVGDFATVEIGDDEISCAIESVAVSLNDPNRYAVELRIPQGHGAAGLRATMRYEKRTSNYDLIIPLRALRQDSNGSFVFLIERQEGSLGSNTYVRRVDVHVLEKDATRAALQGGVSQRDVLALRSDRDINDGDRVRLREGG